MARVVDCRREACDVFIGRDGAPDGAGASPWAIPEEIVLGSASQVAAEYRVWLWREICAGRIDLAALAGLHGRVLGVCSEPEGWHAAVLDSASMYALKRQAERLQERLAVLFGRGDGGVAAGREGG